MPLSIRHLWRVFSIAVIVGVACTASAEPAGTVAKDLKKVADGGAVPQDLTVTYSDMHGLWGGTTIQIQADGAVETRTRKPSDREPQTTRKTVAVAKVTDLVRLLVKLKAWEQRTPERTAVPDESRSTLTIRVNGRTSTMWEWFNDLSKNKRLEQVKTRLEGL